MNLGRLFRHWLQPGWWAHRRFSDATCFAIEQAIATSEKHHMAELCFVVEAAMPTEALLRAQSPRARAIELFGIRRIWDTEHNSGVLIYVQLVDHTVDIVADRGVDARVGQQYWHDVCRRMEARFATGAFEAGALEAISDISSVLAKHFPAVGDNPDELPNRPVRL